MPFAKSAKATPKFFGASSGALGAQMRLSEISKLLNGDLDVAEFSRAHEFSFEEYWRLTAKRGASVPISIDGDIDLLVVPKHVSTACELFISGELSSEALAYLADGLLLSPRCAFLNEEVANYVAEFTDPAVNGSFTIERAKYIADEIRERT